MWDTRDHFSAGQRQFDWLSTHIERFWNFGGVHCEFLNIGDRIENHPKLQGADPYFFLILVTFSTQN